MATSLFGLLRPKQLVTSLIPPFLSFPTFNWSAKSLDLSSIYAQTLISISYNLQYTIQYRPSSSFTSIISIVLPTSNLALLQYIYSQHGRHSNSLNTKVSLLHLRNSPMCFQVTQVKIKFLSESAPPLTSTSPLQSLSPTSSTLLLLLLIFTGSSRLLLRNLCACCSPYLECSRPQIQV